MGGCAKKELSPETINLIKKEGLSREQICKGTGNWSSYQVHLPNRCLSSSTFTPDEEDIKRGFEFKKFELSCSKVGSKVQFGIPAGKNYTGLAVFYCNTMSSKELGLKDNYVYNDESMNELYSIVKKIDEKAEEARLAKIDIDRSNEEKARLDKIEADKIAQIEYNKKVEAQKKAKIEAEKKTKVEAEKVKLRLKSLDLTEKEVADILPFSTAGTGIRNSDIDYYLQKKEDQRRYEEFEKNAKIKIGRQYICSDGYDNWVLKYNDQRATFGGINYTIFYGEYYQRDKYDKDPIIINRVNGTMVVAGNKLTCKPRSLFQD